MAKTTMIIYKSFLLCLLIVSLLATSYYLYTSNSDHFTPQKFNKKLVADIGCKGLLKTPRNEKCAFVKSHKGCHPKPGYIPFLHLFYCTFTPSFAYIFLILCLLIIFYLLGDTSATYFCSSLEGLSSTLKLTPTMAGVTLLALGNGAPDLFAIIISFSGPSDGAKKIGLHGALGSAFFVTTIVVGIISITNTSMRLISMSSLLRDVIFLILSILVLLVIIIFGKINMWAAILFLSLYIVYVVLVCASDKFNADGNENELLISSTNEQPPLELLELEVPLLSYQNEGKKHNRSAILQILKLPFWLPRRLTIPVVSPEEWSKPLAVVSVTTAPVILCVVWNSSRNLIVHGFGVSIGLISGLFVFLTTEKSSPPRKGLLVWFAAGFVMSVTWTYILAGELISLLVTLGLVFGISPPILGLTILAWGNSLGDLVTNVTMARYGGPYGTQIAISGCYAGPLFNIVVGLGLSFVFCTWDVYPSSYKIPNEPLAYETIGFFIVGLIWAVVTISSLNMRLNRLLGCGLIIVYVCFMVFEMARSVPY